MKPALRRALLLAPALLVLGGLFGGALVQAAHVALGHVPGSPPRWTPDPFLDVLRGRDFAPSLGYTLYLAAASTLLSVPVGVLVAWALAKGFPGERALALASRLPLLVPHLVAAFMFLTLLAPTGLVSRVLVAGGVIGSDLDFPLLVHDPAGVGILLAYVWKEAPFVALVVASALRSLDPRLVAQARNLGASEWRVFRHVQLPLALPAIATAGLIVFAFVLGAYELPALLGRLHPSTVPVLAVNRFQNPSSLASDWPRAMAAATVLSGVGLALAAAYLWVVDRVRRARWFA